MFRSAENHFPELRVRVGMHPVQREGPPPPRHYRCWLLIWLFSTVQHIPRIMIHFSWMLFFRENRNVPRIVNNAPFQQCFTYSNMNLTSVSYLFRVNISPFRNVMYIGNAGAWDTEIRDFCKANSQILNFVFKNCRFIQTKAF